jgi:transposase
MVKISCPKCEAKKVYLLSNGKRKCSRCKYEFSPHRLPLYLTKDQWKEIITWFLLEQSSHNISVRTGLERKRVMRALTLIRTALIKDVPEIFSGTVEVDKTYL